ncbi:transcription factor bHLH112 [Vigna radiata var. radiata]|uniref:Transcription factor bHLH112 n=1 Tax=Vigna radiata var. radiata TaxID=3916 RepID=A0A1S3UMH4_VIGRR|nr:transcription factor bHLH112 [Vigna radiata var. radiata]
MAEEFQARICGENWWSSSIDSARSVFPVSSSPIASSPCSVAAHNDAGIYSTRQTDLKATKCCVEETNNLLSNTYLGFSDAHKSPKTESARGSDSLLIDSTLQMMGFGLASSTSDNWNQHLLVRCNGRAESNFDSKLREETGIDSSNSQIRRDWNPKSFSCTGGGDQQIDNFKPLNQEFSVDYQNLCSITRNGLSSNRDFAIGSSTYGNPSTLRSLYEPDPDPQLPQHSLFTNRSMSYSSKASYGTPCTELTPTWSKVTTFLKPTTIAKQHPIGLHFSNNTTFWTASADALHDIRAGTFASSQSQYQSPTFDQEKPNCPSTLLNKLNSEETLDSATMAKKDACEPALKRPRIETPSPLPTFKVRKEKLGDRVTALQQLVSPFGKTDTASVLHEAIEYIKFLHDQVNVLSTSYMKNGAPIQPQQVCDDLKESEGAHEDLKSRGLCLVPISSTFPVATETSSSAELWTPTFRGALLR